MSDTLLLEAGGDLLLEGGGSLLLEGGGGVSTAGKIPTRGFTAGAIKYVVLDGFSPHSGGTVTQGKIPTLGFTAGAIKYATLFGFSPEGGADLTLSCASATYTVSAQDATLTLTGAANLSLSCDSATYLVSAKQASLRYSGISFTITTSLQRGGMIRARTDSNGYLVVAPVNPGVQGTPKQIQSLALGCDDAGFGYLCIAQRAAGSTGPLNNAYNTRLCNDDTGALQTAEKTPGSLDGPLTPFANIRVRTDEDGNLLVAFKTAGTFGQLETLANLRCRTDENGYLLVCMGTP